MDPTNQKLNDGAEVDARNEDGWTALMGAAANGHTATIQALLEAGAAVHAKAEDDDTALSIAANASNTAIVQLLKKAGAKK